MPDFRSSTAFPWWIVVAGFIVAAGYLPTLTAPFDFIDDGNLVYPAPAETSGYQYVQRCWDKIVANVEHLGPFRPTLWIHWELMANNLAGDPFAWRLVRWVWTAMAAMALLWLMRGLKIPPTAALMATAAAMWNPYRNEIWTSLTLAEGVAMPYALAALASARRAAHSARPWPWDLLAVVGLFISLGCKNTFVALVPAMLALRLLPDGAGIQEGWRRGQNAVVLYLAPLAMPAIHFIYFKWNWHPGQYETPGLSWEQTARVFLWLKGAAGLDFLGLGLLGIGLMLGLCRAALPRRSVTDWMQTYRAGLVAAGCLFVSGVTIYLPLGMMAPRYTMPAIWGWDLFLAIVLGGFLSMSPSRWSHLAWGGLSLGLAIMMVANISRQEKVMARSRLLWETLTYLEKSAIPGSRIAWFSGESDDGSLNVEEGIHFQWHLIHRGRGDLRVNLYDLQGNPLNRVELGPPTGSAESARYRIIGGAPREPELTWTVAQRFASTYRFGRKQYLCRVESASNPRSTPPLYLDPWVAGFMQATFERSDREALKRLTPAVEPGFSPSALRRNSFPSVPEPSP